MGTCNCCMTTLRSRQAIYAQQTGLLHNVSFWAHCLIFVLQVEERKRLHQELMEKLNRQGVADSNEVCCGNKILADSGVSQSQFCCRVSALAVSGNSAF